MEPPSPLISGVNSFPSRFVNRSIFICDALESHECACCLLFDVRQNYCQSFLYFHRLSLLSTRETSSRNRSIYKSTRERVDSKGLYGRWRLQLMGSWFACFNRGTVSYHLRTGKTRRGLDSRHYECLEGDERWSRCLQIWEASNCRSDTCGDLGDECRWSQIWTRKLQRKPCLCETHLE